MAMSVNAKRSAESVRTERGSGYTLTHELRQ
jgi:hypothetical protein